MHKGHSLIIGWPIFILSLMGYYLVGYQLARHDFLPLIVIYTLLFSLSLWVYQLTRDQQQIDHAIFASILFRGCLLLAIPTLSDDFYRFLWDGHLINAHLNPFAELPSSIILQETLPPGIDRALYEKLNSPDYYTIYPPLNQVVFWLSTYLFPRSMLGGLITIRLLIIAADIGSIFLIKKLLYRYQLPAKNLLLYALNPLVILELSGNLHFEAFVVLFLLWSLYAFDQKQQITSAVTMAFSIGSKLVPLIFLPLFLKRLKLKNLLFFYALIGLTVVVMFVPLLADLSFINGMSSSLSLYFQKFEFNASIYYLIREIGFAVKGYNIIATAGKALGLATFVSIVGYALWPRTKPTPLPQLMLWALSVYLLFATTVHPWYVVPLIALAVLGRFRFPMAWSYLVFFTYFGYSKSGYEEDLGIVAMEYLLVGGLVLWEIGLPKAAEPLIAFDG